MSRKRVVMTTCKGCHGGCCVLVTVENSVITYIEGNPESLTKGTMCAKGLYNGPCGGTNKGSCEIHKDQPCAWFKIHERLAAQGRLDCIMEFRPAVEWTDQTPRTLLQPGYKKPEAVEK